MSSDSLTPGVPVTRVTRDQLSLSGLAAVLPIRALHLWHCSDPAILVCHKPLHSATAALRLLAISGHSSDSCDNPSMVPKVCPSVCPPSILPHPLVGESKSSISCFKTTQDIITLSIYNISPVGLLCGPF